MKKEMKEHNVSHFILSFVFQFSLGLEWCESIWAPAKLGVFWQSHVSEVVVQREGILIEGFCWDPIWFSGSRSLEYKITTDKMVTWQKYPYPGPEWVRAPHVFPVQSQGKRLMNKNVFLFLITISSKWLYFCVSQLWELGILDATWILTF